jgi:hypothetical protein
MSLKALEGATTSMCAAHDPTWGRIPGQVYVSYIKEIYADVKKCEFPTGDATHTVRMTASGKYSGTDATVEIRQCGYVTGAGTYNFQGTATPVFGNSSGSPHSIAVVCNAVGWMQGSQQIVYSNTLHGTKFYNENFNVPAGYPFITLILYQYVYLSVQPGRPTANYYTEYKTDFANFRIRKA